MHVEVFIAVLAESYIAMTCRRARLELRFQLFKVRKMSRYGRARQNVGRQRRVGSCPEVGPIIHYYRNLSLLSFHHHNAFYTAEALAYDGIPLLDSNECDI